MKTLREKIEIMEAFERGNKIQACFILNDTKYWEDTENPVWDWHFYDYRVKPGKKMTQREFNLIKKRLADWRNERHLTYENQQAGFLGNAFEEISEYFRAKNDLEKIDALCDIVIFCFNSFDLEFKEMGKIYDCDETKISIVDITDDLTYTTAKFMRKDFKDFNNTYRLVFNCEHLCKNLGFDFYKCMLQTIKEIESRTGYYDENLKKFIKDTSDEAKAKWYKADYESCRL
ncbi:TPA: hypothetical protein SHR85_001631 [Campylobacter jejuni]|nr:hypothetical protein [Campylobacter jejuni]